MSASWYAECVVGYGQARPQQILTRFWTGLARLVQPLRFASCRSCKTPVNAFNKVEGDSQSGVSCANWARDTAIRQETVINCYQTTELDVQVLLK